MALIQVGLTESEWGEVLSALNEKSARLYHEGKDDMSEELDNLHGYISDTVECEFELQERRGE